MASKKLTITPHLRWMIRRDMNEVLGIENANFDYPWCEDDFIRCLRQRNCIGMVAESDDRVVGYMIYELHKNRLHVVSLAVHAAVHRMGVGRAMVCKLVGKLSAQRRNKITLEVRESNLDAQLFFRAVGFEAIDILRNFEINGEDAYLMRYRYQPKAEAKVRIAT